MKKRWFKSIGILLIVVGGVLILNSFSGITGLVVLEDVGRDVSGILGVVLVLAGLAVFVIADVKHRRVLREIDESLRSGRAGTYREAEHIARRLGYAVEEGANHKTVYDQSHHVVTQIPRHTGDAPTGLYRAILRELRKHAS